MSRAQAVIVGGLCVVYTLVVFAIGHDVGSHDLKRTQQGLEWETDRVKHCETMRQIAEENARYYQRMAQHVESRLESCTKKKDYCCWLEEVHLAELESINCCDSQYGCWKPYAEKLANGR